MELENDMTDNKSPALGLGLALFWSAVLAVVFDPIVIIIGLLAYIAFR